MILRQKSVAFYAVLVENRVLITRIWNRIFWNRFQFRLHVTSFDRFVVIGD